jgi:hypothetical protein
MLVLVTDMTHSMFGDAKLTLADPTGRITATVHRTALAAEPLLAKGTVLLLQKVHHPPTHLSRVPDFAAQQTARQRSLGELCALCFAQRPSSAHRAPRLTGYVGGGRWWC